MNDLLKRADRDGILTSGTVMLAGSIISGGIDYLFQMFMGRTLGPALYGVLGSLMALSYFSFFLIERTVRISATRYVSELIGKKQSSKVRRFHASAFKWVGLMAVSVFIVFLAASWPIAMFLHIDDVGLVILVAGAFVLSSLFHVNLGTIQGLQRFKFLVMSNIARSASKMVLGIVLVLVGFGLFGAVGAVLLAAGFALLVSFGFIWDKVGEGARPKRLLPFGDVFKLSMPVLVTMAVLAVPTNIDVMLVKNLFTPEEAGYYSAVSVFGRMVLFIPMGMTTVLYPKIVERHASGKDTRGLLLRAVFFTIGVSGLVVAVMVAFPDRVMHLAFGKEYDPAIGLLPPYALMVLLFALITVMVFYNLAKERVWFVYLVGCIVLVEVVVISMYNSSMLSIVRVLLIMNMGLLMLSAVVIGCYPERK